MEQKWDKWLLGAMRKNVNIFFAVIGTVLIDTSFKAFCIGHLEISNFSQNIENLEV